MNIKYLHSISIFNRSITSVLTTLDEKGFVKTKFIPKRGAHPSEGWGWGTAHLEHPKVNKSLIKRLYQSLNQFVFCEKVIYANNS